MNKRRQTLSGAKRIVVKVGSALLANGDQGLALSKIDDYCLQINQLKAQGFEVVLVSSGAIAAGCQRLGWTQRPQALHQLQAAAAVGQMGLARAYESALESMNRTTAMIVLTHDDLADRKRYLNARATLQQLLSLGVLPIINENDTVATDEIRFGDNDTLAALVANLLSADLLLILTDVDGLMDADPRRKPDARRLSMVQAADVGLDKIATAGAGNLGRGGMLSKVRASRLAARSGANTVIASGGEPNILTRVLEGEDLGTLLVAQLTPMTARKRWIADQLRAKGDLRLDDGAALALKEQGVSLLAVGIAGVEGQFDRGEMVRMLDQRGVLVAQGLANYSSQDIMKIIGVKTDAFADHLEYVGEPEVVHRDNLVLM